MNKLRGSLFVGGLILALGIPALALGSNLQVQPFSVKVPVDPITKKAVEQENVAKRLLQDNQPGSLKHFYVIAPKSGQVILYATINGKVTSGGKRLTPRKTIRSYKCGEKNKGTCYEGQQILIQGYQYITQEITQDDGTYGNSGPYFYWLDANDVYHQHFLTDGQIIRISSQPLKVGTVVNDFNVTASANH